MTCTIVSSSGLFTGLWHGFTAFICLILDIFWDVKVYDQCNDSWFYNLGFLIGIVFALATGLFGHEIFIAVIVIGIIVYVIYWIMGAILWVILIGITLIVAFFVFFGGLALFQKAVARFRRRKIFTQKDGSEVIPPER